MEKTVKKKSAKAQVVELKDDEALTDFLVGDGPRVLQLHAEWCAPCQKVAPILEGLAKEFKGRASFGKVDIDECELARDMMEEFGIIGVPAVMILGNGKGGTLVGYMGKRDYRKAIENVLEPEEPAKEGVKEGCGCPMHF